MKRSCLAVLLLLAGHASSQVRVVVQPSKPVYLVGEAVFATVRVTNVGPDAVAYSQCESQVTLRVENQQTRQAPSLWGCFRGGVTGGGLCGVDHPPMLPPGQSTEYRYLLRDYQLAPGAYVLRVAGKAGVRWRFTFDYDNPNAPPPRVSSFHEGDPVPGEYFDLAVPFRVKPGSDAELRAIYAPYVRDASAFDQPTSFPARDTIAEMAPPFLEKQLKSFAADAETAAFAVKGLQRIDTAASRADLVDLFRSSADYPFRSSIVRALAEMDSTDQLPFFWSVLTERGYRINDDTRQLAALALGRLGGDAGVKQLASFLLEPDTQASPPVQSAVVIALASSGSRQAVPVLIDAYRNADGLVQNDICGSLISLTHRNWCVRASDQPDVERPWRRWWKAHRATTKLYRFDQCIQISQAKPLYE